MLLNVLYVRPVSSFAESQVPSMSSYSALIMYCLRVLGAVQDSPRYFSLELRALPHLLG
jgi:hypothetical protein